MAAAAPNRVRHVVGAGRRGREVGEALGREPVVEHGQLHAVGGLAGDRERAPGIARPERPRVPPVIGVAGPELHGLGRQQRLGGRAVEHARAVGEEVRSDLQAVGGGVGGDGEQAEAGSARDLEPAVRRRIGLDEVRREAARRRVARVDADQVGLAAAGSVQHLAVPAGGELRRRRAVARDDELVLDEVRDRAVRVAQPRDDARVAVAQRRQALHLGLERVRDLEPRRQAAAAVARRALDEDGPLKLARRACDARSAPELCGPLDHVAE